MYLSIVHLSICTYAVGTSSGLHKSTKDITNPLYTDDRCKKPVEEVTSAYEEMDITPEVKMTQNPAYAVP